MDVGIGVIGTGNMGADHVRTLTTSVRGARVRAVSDLDADRATAAVAGQSDVRVLTEPRKLIEDPDVDAVVVASADSTHEELVLACLEAGKQVLCEKPLTPTTEGARRIVDAEVAGGRRMITVGFMRRYDPGFARLASGLAAGEIGPALMLHCVHRNARSRPNNPSAQLIYGSAVHEIDVARWLFGQEIEQISVHHGRSSSRVTGSTADPMLLVMRTEGGIMVDVEVFVNCQYGYDVRCELVGESGSLSLDQAAGVTARGARRASTGVAEDWRDRFAEAYRLELQDWVTGVASGEQRGPTTWDGYAATVVAAAGVEALENGTTATVSLAARPDLY